MGYLNKLNGWQRLWLVVAIFTFIALPIVTRDMIIGMRDVITMMLVWMICMVLIYGVGFMMQWVIKWVIKGFRDEK